MHNEKKAFHISEEVAYRFKAHMDFYPCKPMIFTAREAAASLRISRHELRRLVKNGDIAAFSVGPGRPHFFFAYDLGIYDPF